MSRYDYMGCEPQRNGLGIAGFVLALLGLLLCWVPILDWILWALGLVFSFIGVFRAPRGMAIAGLAVSFVALIAMVIFFGLLFATDMIDSIW